MVVPCPGPRTISIYMVAPSPGPEPYQSIWWCLAPGPEPYQSIWWALPLGPELYQSIWWCLAPGPELYQSIFLWFSLNLHETLAGCPLQPSHLQLFPPAVTENMQWRRRYRIILRQQQRRREQPTGFHRPRRGSCLAGFRGLRVSGFRGLAGFSVAGHQAKCLLCSRTPVEQ